jgi:iron uptake system component EfeO
VEPTDAAFVKKVDANFDTIEVTLARYKQGEAYMDYDKLTDSDRKILATAVNSLAEDLSKLRGKLGLE